MSEQLPHDEELRSLYRKLPADEPRAEIDEAILSAARELADAAARELADAAAREAGNAHARQRRRFLARAAWIVPLATAASVILTVSLTRLSPERAEIEPSSLREAADSAGDLQAVARGEQEVWPEESPRAAAPDVAAPEAAPAPPVAAPPAVAAPEAAAPQAIAPEAGARAVRPDADAPAATANRAAPATQWNGDRAPNAKVQKWAAPPPPAAATGKKDAERSQPGAEAMDARRRAETKKESDAAAGSLVEPLARKKAAEESQALSSEAFVDSPDEPEQAEGRARAASKAWPFGLTPGLDAAEACRRLESALRSTCRFEGSEAVVSPKEVAVAERGEFVGRRITRVTLAAAGGRLVEMRLQVEGFTTEQVLVAPAP